MVRPGISRSQDARLQLAAALIEADNDRIRERARQLLQEQEEHRQSGAYDPVGPEPLPQPKFAYESCIFAPYRDAADEGFSKRHCDDGDVSFSDAATSSLRDEERSRSSSRSSYNYLGLEFPNEKKRASLSGSLPSQKSVAGPASRPVIAIEACSPAATSARNFARHARTHSLVTLGTTETLRTMPDAQEAMPRPTLSPRAASAYGALMTVPTSNDGDDESTALSAWGLDKFLSSEARNKLSVGRNRQSITAAAQQPNVFRTSTLVPADSESELRVGTNRHRRHSADPSHRRSVADPALLERIRRYREGLDTRALPPVAVAPVTIDYTSQACDGSCQPETALLSPGEETTHLSPRLVSSTSVLRRSAQRTVSSPAAVNPQIRTIPLAFMDDVHTRVMERSHSQQDTLKDVSPDTLSSLPRETKHSRAVTVSEHVSRTSNTDFGISASLSPALRMPEELLGTKYAPRQKLVELEQRVPIAVPHSAKPRLVFMDPRRRHIHDEICEGLGWKRRRTMPSSARPPPGIGRRANSESTAVFRNLLVQREEDMEGWGWVHGVECASSDDASATVDLEEAHSTPCKDEKKEKVRSRWFHKRKVRKVQQAKRARKEARRERRRKRCLAEEHGMSHSELGVDEFSPAEDLDLSSTSSESGDNSFDTDASTCSEMETIPDTRRPAGVLLGKSLLDSADERKKQMTSKKRFYGQSLRADKSGKTPQGDSSPIQDPSVDDTRERMQAAFGRDIIWKREMAKRLEEDQVVPLALVGNSAPSEGAACGDAAAAATVDDDDGDALNLDHCDADTAKGADEKQGLPLPEPLVWLTLDSPIKIEKGKGLSDGKIDLPWLRCHDEHNYSADEFVSQRHGYNFFSDALGDVSGSSTICESDEDVPLAQIHPRSGSTRPPMDDDEDDDGVPLSVLVSRKEASTEPPALKKSSNWISDDDDTDDTDDDDLPLGATFSNSQRKSLTSAHMLLDNKHSLQRLGSGSRGMASSSGQGKASDSEDDAPLGTVHPQAAVITKQAALIRHMQYEREMAAQTMFAYGGLPGFAPSPGRLPSSWAHSRLATAMTPQNGIGLSQVAPLMAATSSSPLMHCSLTPPHQSVRSEMSLAALTETQQPSSIDDWATQVPQHTVPLSSTHTFTSG